jgi:uncharacterized linocin/CFP29 family protein
VIANAEDRILFLGESALNDPATQPVTVKGVELTNTRALPYGFVAEANQFPAVPLTASDILKAVAEGIAALNEDDQPGPYALFLPPNRYAEAFAPVAGQLVTPGDQIKQIVTGGFYVVNSLARVKPPYGVGILVSLGGEPARIILGTEAITAFTHTDEKSNYHFRVFERIQMVVRDGRAFQTLEFQPQSSSSSSS